MMCEALRSIQEDLQRSLCYWLTFMLTTILIFTFFQIACSPMIGMTFIHSQNNMITYLSVFILAVCLISVFFANNFYVKKKAKDLAIRLVCGATFLQIAIFLFVQTTLLFLCALPFAGFISAVILWLLPMTIELTQEGFYVTLSMLLCEIFWCTILNLGYAYRSSIVALIQGDHGQNTTRIQFPFHLSIHIKKRLSLLLFLVPILLIYIYGKVTSSVILFSIIGMIGMRQCIRQILIPYLDDFIQKHIDQSHQLVYMGFLRRDMTFMENYIVFLIVSALLMLGLFVMGLNETLFKTLICISYIVINCLLSLTILFRFATETVGRQKYYLTLECIGFEKRVLRKLAQKEIILFYGIILGLSLFYMMNIFLSLYIHQLMNLTDIFILVMGLCIPLLFSGIINYFQYKKQLHL